MRRVLILICILLMSVTTSFGAKLPDDVSEYILKAVPNTDLRFDGVIIMPDNTVYLPLFPSLFSDVKKLKIKETYPANMELSKKPDVVIFNNDFVMMKVLTDSEGNKTVLHMSTPPLQVRTGLLPQDMLVPSGLIIPENLKGIIGNLKVDTKSEDIIKVNVKESFEEFLSDENNAQPQALIPQLKNKVLFVSTNYSKNVQVIEPPAKSPKYALAQKSIPVNIAPVENGKFLLVTSYERMYLDIISVADSRYIKQINLGTFPDEIIIDNAANLAYVTAPKASTVFVIDLKTMSMIKKIRVNGYCEKFLFTGDKIFYVDKLKGDIWAIETANDYTLKNIGNFPNVSALALYGNKLYIASRTKSRIAQVDYETLSLINESSTVNKPVAMQLFGKTLYVLGAQNNVIQKIDAETGSVIGNIELGTNGFSVGFNAISGTNLAIITDVKKNMYSVFDLSNGKVLKTYSINVPIKDVKVADKVSLFK